MDARHSSGAVRARLIAISRFLLAILVAGCSAAGPPTGASSGGSATSPTPSIPSTASPPSSPITFVDDEGAEVTIDGTPDQIVSLTPAITETLFALGVGDRVVGRAEDPFLFPPEAAVIPEVARFDSVDVERILALEPDLVFAGGNFFTPPDAIERMRSLGLTVVVLYAPSVDAVHRDIELIGLALGRSAEAMAIAARMRLGFAAVRAAVAGAERPRVFYELDASGAIYGPADDSFLAEMITLAGGEPITTGSPNAFDISLERLIEADPEVILLADAQFGVAPEQVAARPGWSVITAVQSGAIRPIDDQTVTRPGPRLFQGLELLASVIHPDLAIPATAPVAPAPVGP